MKYTKYDNDKKIYITSKNIICESDLDAEWKEDTGIPTAELDIDTTMDYLKKRTKTMGFNWDSSFIVVYNHAEYKVTFTIHSDDKMTYSVSDSDDFSLNLCDEIDIKTPYLITDKDLDALQKTKQQITENLGLSLDTSVYVNIF